MAKTNKPWTLYEEKFIIDRAGIMSIRDIARVLGRTETSVKMHAHHMRTEGRLDKSLRCPFNDEFVSYLNECCECHQLRSTVDKTGICEVCRRREQLKRNELTMHRAWANLPPEYKQRAKRVFDPERAPNLMTKSRDLKMPQRPDTSGMDDFEAANAIDDWLMSVEAYEIAMIKLDIDAVKQRTCKWRRKTRKWKHDQMMKRK